MLRYLFKSKYFKYGLTLTLIGALGIALFGVFRIYAFSYFGPITLPYTTPIDDISAILFFGGLPVFEAIALHKWLYGDIQREIETKGQNQATVVTVPAVATLAEAKIMPAAASVAIPAIADFVFMDEEGVLKFGGATVELPAMKSEHLLCRAMFKHPVNKLVDWTIPYEEMTGEELNKVNYPDEYWKAWHSLYDTTKALNARVKQGLGIELLVRWKDNTLKRTR